MFSQYRTLINFIQCLTRLMKALVQDLQRWKSINKPLASFMLTSLMCKFERKFSIVGITFNKYLLHDLKAHHSKIEWLKRPEDLCKSSWVINTDLVNVCHMSVYYCIAVSYAELPPTNSLSKERLSYISICV